MLGHHSMSPTQKIRPNELGSMNLNLSLSSFYLTWDLTRTCTYARKKKKKKKPNLTGEKPSGDITLGPLDGWKEIHLIGIKSFFDVGAILRVT